MVGVPPELRVFGLSAWYGERQALQAVSLHVPASRITAIIGPSGCGKTTLLRCLNRMHELAPGARVDGRVELDGHDVYAVAPEQLRRRVGMVFQKPNPFPGMSIRDNVLAGLRLGGLRVPEGDEGALEQALRAASLWDEVRDRLERRAEMLSAGEQQRLCIARALVVRPDVLLMDEPCAALDPIATARVEDLLGELRSRCTIVIVTHNMQQAARISDRTGFLLDGRLVELDDTDVLFNSPGDPRTEDYITGKFG